MKQEITAKCDRQTVQANRLAYILYMVLVAYLFIKGDIEWAITNLGIAMVFDPFDANVKWQNRPLYQKVWLIAHVTLTFAGFLYLILR
jgi:cytochrome c biogenesis factor